jgi:hypothetical protein
MATEPFGKTKKPPGEIFFTGRLCFCDLKNYTCTDLPGCGWMIFIFG